MVRILKASDLKFEIMNQNNITIPKTVVKKLTELVQSYTKIPEGVVSPQELLKSYPDLEDEINKLIATADTKQYYFPDEEKLDFGISSEELVDMSPFRNVEDILVEYVPNLDINKKKS